MYKIWFSGPPFDRSRFFPKTVQTDPIPNEIGRITEDKEAQISIKVKTFNVARNFHSFRMSVSFFADPANYTIIINFKFQIFFKNLKNSTNSFQTQTDQRQTPPASPVQKEMIQTATQITPKKVQSTGEGSTWFSVIGRVLVLRPIVTHNF